MALVAPFFVGAQEFQPLTGVPALEPLTQGPDNLSAFFNQLYVLAVGAAAIVAVAQIMIAGFGLAYSGGNYGAIKEARSKIQNAILGLLLVLSPTIVFGIINPDILNLSIDTRILERKEVTEDGTYTQDPIIASAGGSITRNAYGEVDGACKLEFNGDSVNRTVSVSYLGKGDVVVGRACCRLMDGTLDKSAEDLCHLDSLIENDRYGLFAAVTVEVDVENPEIQNGVAQDFKTQGMIRSSGVTTIAGGDFWILGTHSIHSRDNTMLAIHGFRTKGECEAVTKSPKAIESLIKKPSPAAGLLRTQILFTAGAGPEIVDKILRVVSIEKGYCSKLEFSER